MIEIPTKDSEKGKLYFCKQSEEGEWHLLGEATKIESIDDDTVGMDMSGCGFSLDAKTLEFVVEATFPDVSALASSELVLRSDNDTVSKADVPLFLSSESFPSLNNEL